MIDRFAGLRYETYWVVSIDDKRMMFDGYSVAYSLTSRQPPISSLSGIRVSLPINIEDSENNFWPVDGGLF